MRIEKKEYIKNLKLYLCTKRWRFTKKIKLITLRRSFYRRQSFLIGVTKLIKVINRSLLLSPAQDYTYKWKDLYINYGVSTSIAKNETLFRTNTKVNVKSSWLSGKYLSSRKSGSNYMCVFSDTGVPTKYSSARDVVYRRSYYVNCKPSSSEYDISLLTQSTRCTNFKYQKTVILKTNKLLNLY